MGAEKLAPSIKTAHNDLERFRATHGVDSVLDLARATAAEEARPGRVRARVLSRGSPSGQGDLLSGDNERRGPGHDSAAPGRISRRWIEEALPLVCEVLKKPPARRTEQDVDVILPVLQRLWAIHSLPWIVQRALCVVADILHLQQGEYLYRRGAVSDAAYVVLAGEVTLVIPGTPGLNPADIEMGVMREGVGFGDVALLDTITRNSDAFAQESSCALLRLSTDDFLLIINAFQTENLMRTLQTPSIERNDASLDLVKRIVCDKIPFLSAYSEQERIGFARAFRLEQFHTAGDLVFNVNYPAETMYICLSCTIDLLPKSIRRRCMTRTSSDEIVKALQDQAEDFPRQDQGYEGRMPKDCPKEEHGAEEERLVALVRDPVAKGLMRRKGHSAESDVQSSGALFSRRPSAEGGASHSPARRKVANLNLTRTPSGAPIVRVNAGDIFGESDVTTTCPSLYTFSAHVVTPGYVIALSRDDYRRVLNGYEDSSAQMRLMECLGHAFQCRKHEQQVTHKTDEVLPSSASKIAAEAATENEEMLQRLAACFASAETFQAGESLVLQGQKVEDVCIVVSGTCDVKVEIQSFRKGQPGRMFTRTNDRRGHRNRVKVASLGQNALIGLIDAFFHCEVGIATCEATTETMVYKANLAKILSLLAFYQPMTTRKLRATCKNTLMTWASRLTQSINIVHETYNQSGEGEHVLGSLSQQHVQLFLQPPDLASTSRSGAQAPQISTAEFEAITDDLRTNPATERMRQHPKVASDFKSKLLLDDMSVVARSPLSILLAPDGATIAPLIFRGLAGLQKCATRSRRAVLMLLSFQDQAL